MVTSNEGLLFLGFVFAFGIVIGCVMGYFGGWIDLLGQRMIEIWSNVPFLYVVIIIYSVVPSTISIEARIGILMAIMVGFSWMGLTYYMRTGAYKEKARDYVAAAKVLGASSGRIVWKHILPNSIATIVTFIEVTDLPALFLATIVYSPVSCGAASTSVLSAESATVPWTSMASTITSSRVTPSP